MRHLPLLLVLAAAIPAHAATLRTMTTLSAPVVRLSDLFDDAGELAGKVLGSAPPPGERIVVESAQLAAIARQFGVDWRPTSNADRAVLDRPGRLLARDSITTPLLAALNRAGAPQEVDLELPGFEAPLVPTEAQPSILVEQVNYENDTGHFTASVLIAGTNMAAIRLRLLGDVVEIVHIQVPSHRLPAGSVVRADDLMPATFRASALRTEMVRDPAQAVGLALRHAAPAGQPLPVAELQRPLEVAKGAHVAMEIRMPGLTVVAQGSALEGGAMGDHIQVLNPVAHMAVDGRIIGPDRVAVAPDSVPLPVGAAQVAAR